MSSIAPARSDKRLVAIALTLGTLGAVLLLVLPGFVGTLQRLYHFDAAQLGYLSSAHLSGMTLGTALGARLMAAVGLRRATIGGLLGAAIAYGAATFVEAYHPLLFLMLATGAGAGVAIATCFVVLGNAKDVDRSFSLYNVTQLVFGAAALQWLPAISSHIGVRGLFSALAALFVAALLLTRPLFTPAPVASVEVRQGTPRTSARVALPAITVYFAAQCLVWAYLELIGTRQGLPLQYIVSAIALSSLVALLGPTLALLIGARFGRVAPLAIGLTVSLIAVYLLADVQDLTTFTTAACLFNVAWNLSSCFFPAIVAGADPSARLMKWVALATLLGVSVGPLLGALIVPVLGLAGVLASGAVLSVFSFIGFLPACLATPGAARA
jgi:hypothetical protein